MLLALAVVAALTLWPLLSFLLIFLLPVMLISAGMWLLDGLFGSPDAPEAESRTAG